MDTHENQQNNPSATNAQQAHNNKQIHTLTTMNNAHQIKTTNQQPKENQ